MPGICVLHAVAALEASDEISLIAVFLLYPEALQGTEIQGAPLLQK